MDLLVEQLVDLRVQAQVLEEPVDHHADPGDKDSGQLRSSSFGKTQQEINWRRSEMSHICEVEHYSTQSHSKNLARVGT